MEWTVTEQGPRARIEVWRPDDGAGLYKAWAAGAGGSCLLGTLTPEGGRLHLRRTLSIDSLRRQGAWPVQRVEESLFFSFGDRERAVCFSDPVLQESARDLPQHLVQRDAEGFSLSFPYHACAPFPLLPIFCFARVVRGRLIFSFRKDGMPYISGFAGNNTGEANREGRETDGKSDHKGAPRAGGPAGL